MPFSGIQPSVSSMTDGFQGAGLCRGNFFIFEILEGSARRLNRFWARLSVCLAERAYLHFSVSVGEGRSSVNKVLCGTPPSRIADPAYSGRFFQVRYSSKGLFCVARVYVFAISWMVTGLVTVDGNSGRGGVVLRYRCCLLVAGLDGSSAVEVPCWSLL